MQNSTKTYEFTLHITQKTTTTTNTEHTKLLMFEHKKQQPQQQQQANKQYNSIEKTPMHIQTHKKQKNNHN